MWVHVLLTGNCMKHVTLYQYKSRSVCGSQVSCVIYILKLFLVFNKKILIKPIKLFKQVQIFLVYFKLVVIHIIKQIVNPNKWGWNACQEILQSVYLSCGITPEKPKKKIPLL